MVGDAFQLCIVAHIIEDLFTDQCLPAFFNLAAAAYTFTGVTYIGSTAVPTFTPTFSEDNIVILEYIDVHILNNMIITGWSMNYFVHFPTFLTIR